ncbi:MAG: ATP-dependent DNA helicase, partial [Acidimicrobiia bacterium]
ANELIGFNTSWVQQKANQLVMLESFFSAIEPTGSMCLFYAKRTPLSDDPRRVLVGAARVMNKGTAREYDYLGDGELRAVMWEWPVEHSLRPDFRDGFLLPYQELLALSESDASLEIEPCVAFAPEDHWDEFSYSSEHVTHDAAIASLLECLRAISASETLLPGDWDAVRAWIDARLAEIWHMRGPFPGLGAALTAFGLPNGTLLAYELKGQLGDNEDPWPAFQAWLESVAASSRSGTRVGKPTLDKWRALPEERMTLLRLLSRFDLTPEQATRIYQPSEREKARIEISDRDLLANPYLLFELDRHTPDPIAVATVDRGAFPDPIVAAAHPVPEPSRLEDAVDPRRVRALATAYLEGRSDEGHTLRPRLDVVQAIRDMAVSPPCPVDVDLMAVAERSFDPALDMIEMSDGSTAYQLNRLLECGNLIRSAVERRIKGARLEVKADWDSLLEDQLPPVTPDEAEQRAREEKVAALAEIASSRVSVLIGPAGTGKTTLLSVLTSVPSIANGGILLLAPTGKARVQMTKATGVEAKTVAQFLIKLDRYDKDTGAYYLSSSAKVEVAKTVVIDEASMLTEEQLAATLDALKGVDRLILVGDPRQLPPIGSGRPFVDIVARLAPANRESIFPRLGPGYCELTVRRRQQGSARDDLLLADWYS